MAEFELKQERLQTLLTAYQLEALLLRRASSFAWATCGAASYINTASSYGEAWLLVTRERHYLLTNNIEAPRLEREELLGNQGWEFRVRPWHESADVAALAGVGRLGADDPYPGARDLSGEMARLRAALTREEGQRFREVGRLSAEAMAEASLAVRPTQTEFEIAACLAEAAQSRGVQPTVVLVATDERIYALRHPLPTAKPLDRYAMLILCGRMNGLVASVTRLVHFGPMSRELRRKTEAVARVDAAYIQATRPGRRLNEVFEAGAAAYAAAGFPEEWRLHHQGGSAGYEPREVLGTPEAMDVIAAGQAFAWNPSITGAKSEDTILVSATGYEVLTAMEDWPSLTATVDGQAVARPAVLEVV